MDNRFFENPILNSPYAYPSRHWELDRDGQPTRKIVESRRRAEFISPVSKPRKRGSAAEQERLPFDEGKGLSTREQQYERHAEIINGVRREVDGWRQRPDPGHWRVTPETARLLQHWRHYKFSDLRPFFCQVEAVETVIWLTEVASKEPRAGRSFRATCLPTSTGRRSSSPTSTPCAGGSGARSRRAEDHSSGDAAPRSTRWNPKARCCNG